MEREPTADRQNRSTAHLIGVVVGRVIAAVVAVILLAIVTGLLVWACRSVWMLALS